MTAPDQYCINVKKLLGTSKNSASSPNAIKLPANDSASFSFRFIYVHSGAVSDRQWEQFFEVPLSTLTLSLTANARTGGRVTTSGAGASQRSRYRACPAAKSS